MPIVDFIILVKGLEDRLEMREKSAKNGIWVP
jgi:hypothetical protein